MLLTVLKKFSTREVYDDHHDHDADADICTVVAWGGSRNRLGNNDDDDDAELLSVDTWAP